MCWALSDLRQLVNSSLNCWSKAQAKAKAYVKWKAGSASSTLFCQLDLRCPAASNSIAGGRHGIFTSPGSVMVTLGSGGKPSGKFLSIVRAAPASTLLTCLISAYTHHAWLKSQREQTVQNATRLQLTAHSSSQVYVMHHTRHDMQIISQDC